MNPPGPYPYPPAPYPPPRPQEEVDEEQLSTLALGYLIVGIIEIAMGCIPIIHFTVGLLMVLHPAALSGGSPGSAPPWWFGYLFLIAGAFGVITGWTLGITTLIARRFVIERRCYTFLLVLAGASCLLFMPFGLLVGVFTFMLLLRPSIKTLFGK